MPPSDQGLTADRPTWRCFDLGLIVELEFVRRNGVAQLTEYRQALAMIAIIATSIDTHSRASLHGTEEGEVCALEKLGRPR